MVEREDQNMCCKLVKLIGFPCKRKDYIILATAFGAKSLEKSAMNCELIFWKLHGTFPILPVVDLNLPYEVESLHHANCLIGNGMRGTIRSDAGSWFGLFVALCLLLFLTVGVYAISKASL